jgi:hypothetical protein
MHRSRRFIRVYSVSGIFYFVHSEAVIMPHIHGHLPSRDILVKSSRQNVRTLNSKLCLI